MNKKQQANHMLHWIAILAIPVASLFIATSQYEQKVLAQEGMVMTNATAAANQSGMTNATAAAIDKSLIPFVLEETEKTNATNFAFKNINQTLMNTTAANTKTALTNATGLNATNSTTQ
jgi:hypothetical protein